MANATYTRIRQKTIIGKKRKREGTAEEKAPRVCLQGLLIAEYCVSIKGCGYWRSEGGCSIVVRRHVDE